MDEKQRVAEAALAELSSGLIVGLGTGSTAELFLKALGESLKTGRLRDIRGVPTSKQSEKLARELKIPLIELDGSIQIDVTVDGADEIAPNLDLIKGLGGALLREKIVAQNSKRMIVIADSSKLVDKLGSHAPLPVEIVPFAIASHEAFLGSLGAQVALRQQPDGSPFMSDNGNHICDCRFKPIDDPPALQLAIKRRAGIVETGLFLGIASLALVAHADRVQRIERPVA